MSRPGLLAALLLSLLGACQCGEVPDPVDAGDGGGSGLVDGGDGDAVGDGDGDGDRDGDADAGLDAGPGDGDGDGDGDLDAGLPLDAGDFDWTDLFGDGGVPEELACLPGGFDLSVEGVVEFLAFETYLGFSEDGVRCGDELCDPGVPCCELCGYAQCAAPSPDGGAPSCPLFTRSLTCDGEEDCEADPSADVCCYSLGGTECRAAEECELSIPDLFAADGGFSLPDFGDGGFSFPSPPDGGSATLDAGGAPADGGPSAGDAGLVDAGPGTAPVDAGLADAGLTEDEAFTDLLQGGVPVCRSLLDCDVLSGELCCTSERMVSIDLGLCLPALVCLGGGS